jgi:hypothetical protein
MKSRASFDHLVGAGKDGRRNVEASPLRGLEVDHQLIFRRRLHRQVGRLLALEDAIDVTARLSELTNDINPVRDQATSDDIVAETIHSGQLVGAAT